MKRALVLIVLAIIAAAAMHLAAQQPGGYDLLQQALAKERATGQLEAAIALYQQIVRAHAANRPLAAKALLQLARCYDKLGRDEARKTYERVVREYADQVDLAADARARLAAMDHAIPGPRVPSLTARQVWGGPGYVDVSVSSDGRYLSFTDWETGDLAIRDLGSGVNRRLTRKGSWNNSPEFSEFSVISPDGSQVAYAWFNKDRFYELRLVGRDGGQPRAIYRNEEVAWLQPFAWTPDGKRLAVVFRKQDRTNQLALVSVADGSPRVLKSLDWRAPWKMAFSPDGRYIAYDFPPLEDAPERDIFVIAADGSREVPLVTHPAHDFLLGWFPDGRRVLFGSDRMGTNGAWAVRVADGKPEGEVEQLKPDTGQVFGIGFIRAGDYYYGASMGREDVYIATLDPATSRVVNGPSSFAGRFEGGKLAAVWSQDGDALAYLVQSSLVRGGEGANTLAIQTLKTGAVRNIPLKVSYANRLAWLPNGRALIVGGTDLKGRQGLFRVDVATGEFEPILHGAVSRYALAPDGRRLFYERDHAIAVRDLHAGKEEEIYRLHSPSGLALSPDGRWLALKTNLTTGNGRPSPFPSIQIVAASGGGDPRTILTLDNPDNSDRPEMAWSPDGKYVLFVVKNREVWQVPAEGGTPQKLVTDLPRTINRVSIHPDGRRLAISAGSVRYEIWVMEHLLRSVSAAHARLPGPKL